MKVALIDNMNNNFFALTRYFRDLGVEADLFLIPGRTHAHFDPQHDTWQDLRGCKWIKEFPVSYHWSNLFKSISSSVRETLDPYERLIVCGPAIGLLQRANLQADLFIPYGSDLFNLPFPETYTSAPSLIRYLPSLLVARKRAYLQSKGICTARTILCNTNWKTAQDAINRLGCEAVNLPRIMVYKESVPELIANQYSWLKQYDFIVFSPTRHLWKTNADPMPDFKINGGIKRNDRLIRAFKYFVNKKVCANPLLLLCEYGADIEYSKQLISELKIDSFVKWLPLMSRREIVAIMTQVDCVADQFRIGMSATSSGTTNEALAYGAPVISNSDGAIMIESDPYFGCPMLQALTDDEIFSHLLTLANDKSKSKAISDASRVWFDDNLGLGLAKKYLELLKFRPGIVSSP